MYNVTCPHCKATLIDDGALAGQAVQCPTCGGHFTMPQFPVAAPPVQGAGTPPQFAPPAGSPFERREHDYQFSIAPHRATSTAKHTFGGAFGLSAGFALGCLAVAFLGIVLMVGCVAMLAGIGNAIPDNEPQPYRSR